MDYETQVPKRRYSATEAAGLVGVSYSTIRRHIADGKLPAKRDGRKLLIDEDNLRRLYPDFAEPEKGAYLEETEQSVDSTPNTVHASADTTQKALTLDATEAALLRSELQAAHRENEMLKKEIEHHLQDIEHLRSQNRSLAEEASQDHQRIEESRHRQDSIIMKLTQQLEQSQLQLEDLRNRSLWQRFRKKISKP